MNLLQVVCTYNNGSAQKALVFAFSHDDTNLPLKKNVNPVPSMKQAAVNFVRDLTCGVVDADMSDITRYEKICLTTNDIVYFEMHLVTYDLTNHVNQFVSEESFLLSISSHKTNVTGYRVPLFQPLPVPLLLNFSTQIPLEYAYNRGVIMSDYTYDKVLLDLQYDVSTLLSGQTVAWIGSIQKIGEKPRRTIRQVTQPVQSLQSVVPSAPPMPTTQVPDQLKVEYDSHTCVVCMHNTRSVMSLPCKHLALCDACTRTIKRSSNKCPICREAAQTWIEGIKIS